MLRFVSLVVSLIALLLLSTSSIQAGGILANIGSGLADLDRARLQIMGAQEPPQIIVPDTNGLYFRNKSNEAVYICILFYTPENLTVGAETSASWTATGWWKIDPGKTGRVLTAIANRYVYFHAQSRTHFWEGDKNLLVSNGRFTYDVDRTKPAQLQGYVSKSFRKLDTGSATRYVLDLTAPAAPLNLKGNNPPPANKTIRVTFTNRTNQRVNFFLNGGKGLNTGLNAGQTSSYNVAVSPNVTPAVSINQPKGPALSFSLMDGGNYEFRFENGKIKNFVKN
jgi:uncharacterized membrane protein